MGFAISPGLTISAIDDDGVLVDLVLQQAELAVVITVADKGRGIAPQQLPHVFERFRPLEVDRQREDAGGRRSPVHLDQKGRDAFQRRLAAEQQHPFAGAVELGEGAQGDAEATIAWQDFQRFVRDAKNEVTASHEGGFYVDFSPAKHTGSRFVDLTILTADGKVRR